jgi:hypothetical protein
LKIKKLNQIKLRIRGKRFALFAKFQISSTKYQGHEAVLNHFVSTYQDIKQKIKKK